MGNKYVCKVCGAEKALLDMTTFESDNGKHTLVCKHCASKNLKSKRKYVEKSCEVCNKKFSTEDVYIRRDGSFYRKAPYEVRKAKYCSQECSGIASNKEKPKTLKIKKICKVCGKEFKVWPYRSSAEYCSTSCHYAAGNVKKTCPICGKIYKVPKWLSNKVICDSCKDTHSFRSKGEYVVQQFLIEEGIQAVSNSYLNLNSRIIRPDFRKGKKILEYYGDYWHQNPSIYKDPNEILPIQLNNQLRKDLWTFDEDRLKCLHDNGYITFIVWENDWKTNQAKTKKAIKEFFEEKHEKSSKY